jgi:hypothetical protein
LWISRKKQYWRVFTEENAPRGTFLWNDNPQILVFVENFLIQIAEDGDLVEVILTLASNIRGTAYAHFDVGLWP